MVRAIVCARTESDEGSSHSRDVIVNDGLFDLSGQVAIVTGTSRGLGQYMARALAKAGADLVLTSRNRDRLLPFEKEIRALGRRAVSLELDVRELESISRMVASAEAAFGHLDILVNNAWVEYLCDRIPVKRPGQPEDLDAAIVFLAAESSRYVTGQTLLVDGGISTGATRALSQSADARKPK